MALALCGPEVAGLDRGSVGDAFDVYGHDCTFDRRSDLLGILNGPLDRSALHADGRGEVTVTARLRRTIQPMLAAEGLTLDCRAVRCAVVVAAVADLQRSAVAPFDLAPS